MTTAAATRWRERSTGRPVLQWRTFDPDAVLRDAADRFRRRLLGGKGVCAAEDAGELAEEVIDRVLSTFRPLVGERILHVAGCNSVSVVIDGYSLPQGRWAGQVREGDSLRLYCLSGGATVDAIWNACGQDMVLAATAHLLGSEVIYALTRRYDRAVRNTTDGEPWRKLALLAPDGSAPSRCQWDPEAGRMFFSAFAGADAPMRISAAGSFDPVHSVLGLFRRTQDEVSSVND